ncbi:MAG TPA: complex I NDUFA9 subunit family protein [Burkholderiaceae bacterium]|nr:complex I NDUFA9 subunit family protein [Burkholderiaceae bacterium]HQZ06607.1 complex I NDUFA9 subunit family protein [Burkholderiaceae bacterium]
MKRILVLGGSGFIGRHLCEKAGQLNCRLTVPTRHMVNARAVAPLPWVDVVETDIHVEMDLTRLVRGHDAVINLVAILHGDAAAFNHVHVALVQKLARACIGGKVRHLVHVSALGAAADAPSMYQRSKAEGEAVLLASKLATTILRPSVVFGAQDRFLNMFAKLQAIFPVMPLAGADTRFQPVWVQDVAQAIVNRLRSLDRLHAPGAIAAGPVFEACGPDVFTLRELVRLAGRLSGNARPVIALPDVLARLQATVMEWLPGEPLMSRDNLASLQVDNIASGVLPGLEELGIRASSLPAIAPSYLRPGARDPLLALRRQSGPL